jgi:hypothetical protein
VNRIAVVAVVLGAFLLGGVGTGATYARWVDQAPLPSSSAGSGAMSFTAAAAPASLSVARGTTATTQVTVTDTSQGKNLVQRVTPTVAATNGVTASLVTRSGGSCTTTAQAAVALTPTQSFSTCVNVTVPSGTTASSATATVTLNGAQVRGSTVAGWTSGPRTVTLQIAITDAAPIVSCGVGVTPAPAYRFTWTGTGSSYRVYRSSSSSTGFTQVATTTGTSYTETTQAQNQIWYFRVTQVTGSTESAPSNTIRVDRSGNSNNYTCGAP